MAAEIVGGPVLGLERAAASMRPRRMAAEIARLGFHVPRPRSRLQ